MKSSNGEKTTSNASSQKDISAMAQRGIYQYKLIPYRISYGGDEMFRNF